jgi:sigma-B regulation protein RsbU (phosphoserine phosphatase)
MAKTAPAANSTPAKEKSESSIQELSAGAEGSRGNSIIALASSFHYVRSDEKLGDFALALAAEGTPPAVAVVDGENRALGIVVKRDFQENLSKLYWRDLHRDERMQAHRVEARSVDATMPILSAADELLPDMSETGVRFFLLEREGKYAGIFSSLDLFRYLTVLNQKDLALAKFLQGRLTPEKHRLKTEHGVLYGLSKMARGVGGDYYRATKMADGSVRAAICDVSGKGVAASLVTAVLAGMLEVNEQAASTGPFGTLLERINRFICMTFENEKFVTGVFIDWNPRSRQMDLYDCGHGMTYLWRQGSFMEVDTHGQRPHPRSRGCGRGLHRRNPGTARPQRAGLRGGASGRSRPSRMQERPGGGDRGRNRPGCARLPEDPIPTG